MSSSNGRGPEVDAGAANRKNKQATQTKQPTNFPAQQNPFSKPLAGLEEAKQPAGGLPVSKKNSSSVNTSLPTRGDLRLLVLADTTASFYSIEDNTSPDKDKNAPEVWL